MARLFGTDGVRGLANDTITADLALKLGEAAARRIGPTVKSARRKPRAIVGRDTRMSGEFLDHAISAGLAAAGVDAVRIGVVPTPAVAHICATNDDIDFGVMISASHNPMPDNGIKFFAHGGYKLDDAIEDELEALLGTAWERPVGDRVGEVWYDDDMAQRAYVDHIVQSCGVSLKGLRIAVDCANGAASVLGPEALRAAGADVVVINAFPDGRNINDECGSTHPSQLQAVTVASGANFGVAYDGDADRCIAVDHRGNLVDGDRIMGVLATQMKEKGELAEDTLVVTIMSNLGLLNAMKALDIKTVVAPVGDRYVLEAMQEGGFNLGGEQSGHVIASNYATTGDGVLTSVLLGRAVKETGMSLGDLADRVPRLPQTLVNVKGVDRTRLDHEGVQEAVRYVEDLLGDQGRVLLRPSGTEPVVRVMVEAPTQQQADGLAETVAASVRKHLAV